MRLILTNMENRQIADEVEGASIAKSSVFLLDGAPHVVRKTQNETVMTGRGPETLCIASVEPIQLKNFVSRAAQANK